MYKFRIRAEVVPAFKIHDGEGELLRCLEFHSQRRFFDTLHIITRPNMETSYSTM